VAACEQKNGGQIFLHRRTLPDPALCRRSTVANRLYSGRSAIQRNP
jgi:hypothetical protein